MARMHQADVGDFRIKSYGRTELAQLYNPTVAAETAWRKLRSWIAAYPGLLDQLKAIGYHTTQRTFTPAEVRLIVEAIGEP